MPSRFLGHMKHCYMSLYCIVLWSMCWLYLHRLFIEEVVSIVTPYNFALICSLLYSKSCYTRFVGSITDQLAVFQCLDVILSETFRLDIFLDLLYEQDFFTDEERERIECHITFSGSSKQKAFIDVLKSKLVEECCSFQKFFDCLNTDSTLKELELKIFEKNTFALNVNTEMQSFTEKRFLVCVCFLTNSII